MVVIEYFCRYSKKKLVNEMILIVLNIFCRWFEYMGDIKSNAFVPFQINFIVDDSPLALNPSVNNCNETYEVNKV